MTEALTVGWTAARAQTRRRTYQRILGFNMVLHVLIGLACMFAPDFVSRTFGLPPPVPSGWLRAPRAHLSRRFASPGASLALGARGSLNPAARRAERKP